MDTKKMRTRRTNALQETLSRYSLYLTRDRREAEDLAQETWARALSRDDAGMVRHRNPEAWMLRIARNIWTDQGRRRSVLARIMEREYRQMRSAALASAAADNGPAMLEPVFRSLMKHLTPLQRAVFMLREVYEYSTAETAERLAMSEGAVKAALRRARRALPAVRRELADEAEAASLPAEENWKAILHSLALAYEAGDVAAVVALLARDVREPAAAIGTAQVRARHAGSLPRAADRQPGPRMAA